MLPVLKEIFDLNSIEINNKGERIPLHSNTSKKQGEFLQEMFDLIKPNKSLEVGFAYGISTLFILEKHCQHNSNNQCHIVIEPDDYWGSAAVHNITKEGLLKYLEIKKDYSDKVLTSLFHQNHRIQFAYIDTTKVFDTVLQDFYFIDKMLDVGGMIILDDCNGGWPGVQRVARFINTLPHYTVYARHNKSNFSLKRKIASKLISSMVGLIPFKSKLYPTSSFKTEEELLLDYSCIAFKKTAEDTRNWDWDKTF